MARKKKKIQSKGKNKTPEGMADQASPKETTSEIMPGADTHKKYQAEVVDESPSSEVPSKLPALSDGISMYLKAIQKYPLLSREEEYKIAERYYKEGDPKDAEILVTANLRFVVKVAAEYSNFGSKLIDLIQEGNVGLMQAVHEYNPYKGARLITYAVWWIKGYIQDYLMKQHSMVKIGTTHNQRKLYYNLEKEKAEIDRLGMEPTVKLLSDRLGVSEKDVRLMEKRLSGKDLSLDQPIGGDSDSTFLDFESTDETDVSEQLAEKEAVAHLHQVLDRLRDQISEKEMYILENRLLNDEPKTLQEIGDEWEVTREAVRQMEARLMKKIKKELIPKQVL